MKTPSIHERQNEEIKQTPAMQAQDKNLKKHIEVNTEGAIQVEEAKVRILGDDDYQPMKKTTEIVNV